MLRVSVYCAIAGWAALVQRGRVPGAQQQDEGSSGRIRSATRGRSKMHSDASCGRSLLLQWSPQPATDCCSGNSRSYDEGAGGGSKGALVRHPGGLEVRVSVPIVTMHGPLTLVWGDVAELDRAVTALRQLLGPLALWCCDRSFISWGA